MKRFAAVLIVSTAGLVLAACGRDNAGNYVLDTSSASASASARASASASSNASAQPGTSALPASAATPIADNLKIIIDSPGSQTPIGSPVPGAGEGRGAKGPGA